MKKYKIEVKWAILFVLMTLVWMFLERLFGLHSIHIDKHAGYTNFYAIPAIAIYVFALLDKRKNYYSGLMTYKQGFICGLIITGIIAVLSPLTQIIISRVITPEFFPNAIAYSVESGYMTAQEAQKYFSLTNYIIQGFVSAIVMGTVTSAIVALFIQRKANAVTE